MPEGVFGFKLKAVAQHQIKRTLLLNKMGLNQMTSVPIQFNLEAWAKGRRRTASPAIRSIRVLEYYDERRITPANPNLVISSLQPVPFELRQRHLDRLPTQRRAGIDLGRCSLRIHDGRRPHNGENDTR